MVIGHTIETSNEELIDKNTGFDRCLLQEYYSCYSVDEMPGNIRYIILENMKVNLYIPKIENDTLPK